MLDAVDGVLLQWGRERPDVDTSPMGVIGRISRAAALLDKSISRTLAEFGLLPGEFDLLATLRRSGAPYRLAVGDLLRCSMVTSGAITNRLNHLEAAGLVTRELDPQNRRSVLVTLTEQGIDVVERALPAHVDNERGLLQPLTPRQQQQLAGLLRQLLTGLGDLAPDKQASAGDPEFSRRRR